MAQLDHPGRATSRPVRRLATSALCAVLAVVYWLLGLTPANSFASTPNSLTVTATASPQSGGTLPADSTVTYMLQAESQQALPSGGVVVDDLAGLLGHATVTTSKADLAKHGLTLDTSTGASASLAAVWVGP